MFIVPYVLWMQVPYHISKICSYGLYYVLHVILSLALILEDLMTALNLKKKKIFGAHVSFV